MQDPTSTPPSYDATPETPTVRWYEPLTSSPVATLLCMALPLGMGIVAAYVAEPEYLARTKIILPNAGGRSGSPLAGLASSIGLGSDTSSLPMFTAILKSERMISRLSSDSALPRKKMRKYFAVRDDAKSSTIEITAAGPGEEKMLAIVKRSLKALDDITGKVNLPVKQDQTSRLLAALDNRRRGLTRAETELREFLATSKTLPGGGLDLASRVPSGSSASGEVAPTSDIASIQPGLGYKQQLSSLEIELQKLDSSLASINATATAQEASAPLDLPPVRLWAEKIATAQTKLAEARTRYQEDEPEIREAEETLQKLLAQRKRDVDAYLASVRARLTGPAQTLSVTRAGVESQIANVKKYVDASPDETIRYLRLLRDVKSNEQVVGQIQLQYEKARLDQGNDPNTWSVLDLPEIDPEYEPRKTKRNTALGGMVGLLLAYGLGSRRIARKRP